jgi:hypothetical protein
MKLKKGKLKKCVNKYHQTIVLLITYLLYMATLSILILGFSSDQPSLLIYTADVIWFTLLVVANCSNRN